MADARRLVATMTAAARGALERAAERALGNNHAAVELEHFLLELCLREDNDVALLLRQEQDALGRVRAGLEGAIRRFASASPRIPPLSAALLETLRHASVASSVEYGLKELGSAAIVCAVREEPPVREALLASVPAFCVVFDSRLARNLADWLHQSVEIADREEGAPEASNEGSALAQYTIDLTAQARGGLLDPVIGREREIGQIIDVLMRRHQNNPILVGPAGVGKTAIVEGFAQALADERVPQRLAGSSVRTLDLALIQAGSSMRGEFERRLRAVVDEASASEPLTVLFIDEAHMLIGAGGAAGQGDAANLLKPALARGALGVIAATTSSEYKRFIEKDPGLARRFEVIRVEEPSEAAAVAMLRGLAPKLGAHHGVRIREEALSEAVRLSHRYITGRHLPEKAIAVLDTACGHVAIETAPAAALIGRPAAAASEQAVQAVDHVGGVHGGQLLELEEALERREARRAQLEIKLADFDCAASDAGIYGSAAGEKQRRATIGRLLNAALMNAREAGARIGRRLATATRFGLSLDGPYSAENGVLVLDAAWADFSDTRGQLVAELTEAEQRCAALAAEIVDARGANAVRVDNTPVLKAAASNRGDAGFAGARASQASGPADGVDGRAVAQVVASWTGIPVGRMLIDTLESARSLKARMAERIVEQDAALDAICRRIQTFYAGLGEPSKPTGVFLLCGPSGVGKTETALTLADLLFGGARALITVNMSEYQEAHSVSGLRGAPPGYVGYGSGGRLTEAVRRQPYSVVLLDEVEKAHPDVLELFYQVFDRGMLEDSEGQPVDFTNTVIFLTSNIGAEILNKLLERHPAASAEALVETLRPALERQFSPALLGRLVVAPYRPLTRRGVEAVTRLKLRRIQERFAAGGRGELTYDSKVTEIIAARARAAASGARMVDEILTHDVLPELSARILERVTEGRAIAGAHLSAGSGGAIAIAVR